jgi:hypothetical protein
MAHNHLTPTELAREAGLGRREVLHKCLENGVPVFKGRIDKSLFLAAIRESPPHTTAISAVPAKT